ncbi:MAG: hypothetical protein GY765_11205 [bacterium]|nr:hypothetical protein [bacterium]
MQLKKQKKKLSESELQYSVSVNVRLLPVYARDKKGEPVFDLKKEDLELFVNGKPYDIAMFKRYEFKSSRIDKTKTAVTPQEPNERVVFIIIDTMFNSKTGFRRSKKIAMDLIKKKQEGDHFIVFENSSFSGLTFVGGSQKGEKKLLRKIKRMSRPIERWATQMHRSRIFDKNVDFSLFTEARLETGSWKRMQKLILDSEKMRYKYQLKKFCNTLSRFKYILKTIAKPKLVFLISEGMAAGAFKASMTSEMEQAEDPIPQSSYELNVRRYGSILVRDEQRVSEDKKVYSGGLFRYLRELVKSVNFGGSVLYTINPARSDDISDDMLSGEMSLKYIAHKSGGKYFGGDDLDSINKRIKKTTSAYYELVFYTDPINAPAELDVKIKCKRKGVRVSSLNYTEGSKSYPDMEMLQKKMFAYNVISGGNWSRRVGKVMRAKYTELEKNPKKENYAIRVPLPDVMRSHKLDMFLVRVDPETRDVEIDVVSKKAKDWVDMTIKPRADREQYFVIIEPDKPYCIYNQTK